MEKEILIKKWLDNELSPLELEQFKQLEEYKSYMELSEKAHLFKAPDFNSSNEYEKLKSIIDSKRTTGKLLNKIRPVMKVAAVFIIGFVIYSVIFTNHITTINTIASEKTIIDLPDKSVAQLNSLSELSFDKNSWSQKRNVELNGEAYFKVAKGSQFDVHTSAGIVSVLGTQFNVKNRNHYFEVTCYEGKVSVNYKEKSIILIAQESIRFFEGKMIEDTTIVNHPSWIDNQSSFKSIPFSEVIAEFERQYNVNIDADMNLDALFTGTFTHTDKKLALSSITIPMNLKYTIENNTIRIYE